MEDCVFCKIINGELPCYKIYEDNDVLAFLDISNDYEGHTLVIPKKHYIDVSTVTNNDLSKIISVCKIVGDHYVNNCGYTGYNIINATKKSAGQTVFHLHFHIIPRTNNDNYHLINTRVSQNYDLIALQNKLCIKNGIKH